MFNFFQKKAEVLEHWISFAEGFQFSPAEFYTAVEKDEAFEPKKFLAALQAVDELLPES